MKALVRRLRAALHAEPTTSPRQAAGNPAQAIRDAERDIAARLAQLEAQTQMRVSHLHQQHEITHGIPGRVVGVRIGLCLSGSDQ